MNLSKNAPLLLITCAIFAVMITIYIWKYRTEKIDSKNPYSLAMTFRSDAATSRAFTWRSSDSSDSTVLQVAAGADKLVLEQPGVITFKGTATSSPDGDHAIVHKAEATGLKPDTQYWYRVGNGSPDGWSDAASFVTAPAGNGDVRFIAMTDSQGETEKDFLLWAKTVDNAVSLFPQAAFLVHNGDLTENPDDPKAWRYLFDTASTWLSRIPLMPVTGNHDEVDGKADHFLSRFYLPTNGAKGSLEGTSYSFDYGSVHVTVLNTESNISNQTQWLRQDLANTDKPWKIVAMHRGLYGGNTYKKIEEWGKIIDQYKVDLVLQGHNHEYSRSYPLRDGKVTADGDEVIGQSGTVYVVTNTAGPKFNKKKDDQFYHKVHFQNEKQMFAGITITGSQLTYQAYDVDGLLLDHFTLKKR